MKDVVRQLALDLPHRAALGREDFLVAEANEMAVAWIDRWPDWPQPALLIHGPAGSGKTHLASVWRHISGAVRLDRDILLADEPPALLGKTTAAVVDGIEQVVGSEETQFTLERKLLHVYNMMRERRGHLLVTGRGAPSRWPLRLPDLRSRLAAAPAVGLGAPDDRLIAAVMVKLFSDRQLKVEPAVVNYLLTRMERSFAAARHLVSALDQASLAARREITVPLARRVLECTTAPDGTAHDDIELGEDDHGSRDRG